MTSVGFDGVDSFIEDAVESTVRWSLLVGAEVGTCFALIFWAFFARGAPLYWHGLIGLSAMSLTASFAVSYASDRRHAVIARARTKIGSYSG